ncbi:unnamed protein product [Adineta steineri]|uniref:Uncharacterized protein n=1 Tax=Adineta steineri TaxID=433720 RepID=A0A813RTM4_9BILA|nr:unnamed protein product [Adineta steineri]CAF3693159.1 unnamed protein product [Adineta steineri]
MRPTRETSASAATIEQKTKILRITLAATVLSFIIFLITLTSSHWVLVTYPPPSFFSIRQNMFVNQSRYGIIWECVKGGPNRSSVFEYKCDFHPSHVPNTSLPAEQTLIGMTRTMLSFSIIHILLVIITFICGLYSIRDYRYTYKRLTGMIYILSAAALVVCIEVLSTIFRHSTEHLSYIYPTGTKCSYGVCYIIAWIIFIQLLGSSFIFFACSKKRKGTFDEATEEEALANRPVDLGRSFR